MAKRKPRHVWGIWNYDTCQWIGESAWLRTFKTRRDAEAYIGTCTRYLRAFKLVPQEKK